MNVSLAARDLRQCFSPQVFLEFSPAATLACFTTRRRNNQSRGAVGRRDQQRRDRPSMFHLERPGNSAKMKADLAEQTMKQVLFLCSGNYYRSRFAEQFFNWLAAKSGLLWRADSRGLRVEEAGNIGAISRFAVEGLKDRGIPATDDRYPIQLSLSDLTRSEMVIAVKEAEHRSMILGLFPNWADAVEYWHVDDLDCAGPEKALAVLAEHVQAVVEKLLAAQKSQVSSSLPRTRRPATG